MAMSLDTNAKRKALRRFSYGLYIVTAADQDTAVGGTITWVTQASFKPPMVMLGIQQESSLRRVIAASGAFAVHVVARGQLAMARCFMKGASRHGRTLNRYPFEDGVTGAPVLKDASAWLECRVLEEIRRGDHSIFVAEVVAAGVKSDEEPLPLRETGLSYGG
jgi:flavin reductase (DIM6/NTAB) family NADH-FMN oxidoreductase RutF